MSLLDQRDVLLAGHLSRRDRKRLRRTLRDQDRISAKLVELHRIVALLAEATHHIDKGWMQHGWFAYVHPSGERRIVTGYSPRITRRLSPEQVVSTCLVGAIVHAGGGPSEARSQLVQRTIDLTWHASFRGTHEPVRWCPSPVERAGHLMDLVRWNDHPGRTSHEVAALLDRTRLLAQAEAERARAATTPPDRHRGHQTDRRIRSHAARMRR
ncbi:DUF6197 family protein [Nocardioides sp.]|uniref:DUF6197 family protein n=1 Tax=Nocardioides sp. TaxID=35761 RepID=UPI002F3F8FC1